MFLLKRNSIYYVEYLDVAENRIRRVSTHQRIKRDAIKFLTDFEKNLKAKKSFKHILLEEYERQYSEYIKTNLSAKYYQTVKLSFKQLIDFTSNIPISKLTYPLLDKYFTETFNRTQQGAWTYYRILKSAFNKAIGWNYLENNPFNKIKLPKIPKSIPTFISENELNKILDKETKRDFRDIYFFAFYTGCKIGEILNLKWNSIDLKSRIITVKNSKEFTTKSKKDRVVPINDKLFKMLKNRIPRIQSIDKTDLVFEKTKGIKYRSDTVSKCFKKAVRKAKLNELIHLHTLRHSFASNLVKKDVSLYIVKELLGHKDITTTQVYSHLTIESLRSAVKVLDRVG